MHSLPHQAPSTSMALGQELKVWTDQSKILKIKSFKHQIEGAVPVHHATNYYFRGPVQSAVSHTEINARYAARNNT